MFGKNWEMIKRGLAVALSASLLAGTMTVSASLPTAAASGSRVETDAKGGVTINLDGREVWQAASAAMQKADAVTGDIADRIMAQTGSNGNPVVLEDDIYEMELPENALRGLPAGLGMDMYISAGAEDAAEDYTAAEEEEAAAVTAEVSSASDLAHTATGVAERPVRDFFASNMFSLVRENDNSAPAGTAAAAGGEGYELNGSEHIYFVLSNATDQDVNYTIKMGGMELLKTKVLKSHGNTEGVIGATVSSLIGIPDSASGMTRATGSDMATASGLMGETELTDDVVAKVVRTTLKNFFVIYRSEETDLGTKVMVVTTADTKFKAEGGGLLSGRTEKPVLHVEDVLKGTKKYEDAEKALRDNDVDHADFAAVDISFRKSAGGTEDYEPYEGQIVNVRIETRAIADFNPDSVSIQHHLEDGTLETVAGTTRKTKQTFIEINDDTADGAVSGTTTVTEDNQTEVTLESDNDGNVYTFDEDANRALMQKQLDRAKSKSSFRMSVGSGETRLENDTESETGAPKKTTSAKTAAKTANNTSTATTVSSNVDANGIKTEVKEERGKGGLKVEDGRVVADFVVDSFSVYTIVGTVFETRVLASDGRNYRIVVTCGPEAGIPKDADLEVTEILPGTGEYKNYVGKTEDTLGWKSGSTAFARMFDIKIVDLAGKKIQPKDGSSVRVEIELENSPDAAGAQIVHFADQTDSGSKINNVEAEENKLAFSTSGFSIYVIADNEHYARLVYKFHDIDNDIISTQYIKKYLDTDGNTQYETLYDPGLVPDYGQRLLGWAYSQNETTTERILSLADLNVDAQTKLDTAEDEQVVDVYAIMDEAWYLRYMDIDENGIITVLHTDVVSKNAVGDDRNVDINYMVELPEGTVYQGWYDPTTHTTYSPDLYKGEASEYETIPLERHMDLYLKLNDRFWLVFDSNAGGPGSGASYTPPQLIYTRNDTSKTKKPANPTRKGYTFTGWNTQADGRGETWLTVERQYDAQGNLISTTYPIDKFGESLSEDTILYAQWTADKNRYRIAYWRQKETDAVDLPDTAKTYDFFGYREITTKANGDHIVTGDEVSASNNDKTMSWVAEQLGKSTADANKFRFNANRSDVTSKVVEGDGSTVLNMYFDREVMTFIFDRNFTGYTATENPTGTAYGYVDGQYVELRKSKEETVYTYTFQYTYSRNDQIANTRYGLINGEYVPLTRDDYVSVDNGKTEYTAQRYDDYTLLSPGKRCGIVNGKVVEITFSFNVFDFGWHTKDGLSYSGTPYVESDSGIYGFDSATGEMVQLTSHTRYLYNGEVYPGVRYVRDTGGDTYTGTRYTGINGSVTEEHSGTQYGIDVNGGYVQLVRSSSKVTEYVYEDADGNEHVYEGVIYEQSTTNTLRGLYGSQMKPGEWPAGYWQYANTDANSYNSSNNRTTLNAAWTSYTISNGAYEYAHGTPPYTTWHLFRTTHTGNVVLNYWRQDTEGNYKRADMLQTNGENNGSLVIANDKFYAFSLLGFEYGGQGGTPDSSGNSGDYGWHTKPTTITMHSGHGEINIYYKRDKYKVFFQSNNAESEIIPYSDDVFYEKNLSFLKDFYTPAEDTGKDGYYFAGWYKDANFTKPFDFDNETMPHNDLVLYGKWDTYRVRVVLVPTYNHWHDDDVHFPNNQALTFRLDYNDKIDDTNISSSVAKRLGYTLTGWYTTPDFQNGTEWNFDTHINKEVSAVDMDYHNTPDWEDNVYGDNDGKHDDVEGILKLYAKWELAFSENDLFIQYEVPERFVKRDAQGTLITEIPYDTNKYSFDPAHSASITAVIQGPPENYLEAYAFRDWVLLDNQGNETETTYGANNTETIMHPENYIQAITVMDEDGHPKNMMVIVLRAQFDKSANNQGTVVTFDGNGGAFTEDSSLTKSQVLLVNEAFNIPASTEVKRDGYTLLGWSFDKDTTVTEFNAALETAGGDASELAKLGMFENGIRVGADNLTLSEINNWDPLENTIYAVWKREYKTLTLTKTLEGERAGTTVPETFSVQVTLNDPYNGLKDSEVTDNVKNAEGITNSAGVVTLEVAKDGTASVITIPADTRYKVAETHYPGFEEPTYKLTVGNGTPVDYTENEEKTITADSSIEITNTLRPILTVKKTVTGNMGHRYKAFKFTLTLDEATDINVEGVDQPAGQTDKKKWEFSLAHDQQIVIPLPKGTKFKLAEEKVNYIKTFKIGDTEINENEEQTINGDLTITVTNHRDVTVPTGINTDLHFWKWLIGACFLALIGAAMYGRKKRRM